MSRLVVLDAVLLALVAAHVVWVVRINRGSRIKNFLTGFAPAGRERWVGRAVTAVVIGGLFLGAAGYGLGTRLVNILVFFALMAAVYAGGAGLHNRAVDRR